MKIIIALTWVITFSICVPLIGGVSHNPWFIAYADDDDDGDDGDDGDSDSGSQSSSSSANSSSGSSSSGSNTSSGGNRSSTSGGGNNWRTGSSSSNGGNWRTANSRDEDEDEAEDDDANETDGLNEEDDREGEEENFEKDDDKDNDEDDTEQDDQNETGDDDDVEDQYEEKDPEESPEQFDLSDSDNQDASDVVALNLDQQILNQLTLSGIVVEEEVSLPKLQMRLTRLSSSDGLNVKQILKQLREKTADSFVESNAVYRLASAAKPCAGIRCYGAEMTGFKHSKQNCDKPIRIGMIDSNVQPKHPAFIDQALTTKIFSDKPSGDRHGTAIASQLIGNSQSDFPGLVPDADLFAANVFAKTNTGELTATVVNIAKALDWLIEKEVKVINFSLTGPENGLLRNAVYRATERGIVIAAAAGNGGASAAPVYPAAYDNIIAVTAVDRHQQAYGEANRGRYIDLAAPGVSIWLPFDDSSGYFDDGTSYATAFVTAASAIILSENKSIKPDQVIKQLQQNAKDLGASGYDEIYGWGLLQQTNNC